MPSVRRLAIYAALSFPLAYIMGITFLERRLASYRLLAWIFGSLAAVWAFDRVATTRWPAYRARREAIRARTSRAAHVVVFLAFAAGLLVPSIVLIPIGAGIFPLAYAALTVALALAVYAQRRFARRWPPTLRLDAIAVVLALNYTGVATMAVAYIGSLGTTCTDVAASPYLIPLATRAEIASRDDIGSCFPYDVKTDAAADRIFFTLKQRRSGLVKKVAERDRADDAIGAMSLANPDVRNASLIPVVGATTGSYPQRITVNPGRREIYVVVLDIDGHHSIRVIGYDGEFAPTDVIALDFEPIRVYFDESRLIVVGYEGVVGVYDIATHARLAIHDLGDLGFLGTLDTLVHRPDRHLYYASVVSRRFLALDDQTFTVTANAQVGVPTIGLDYDVRTNRVFAAATLTREVLVLDGDTLRVVDRIPVHATVRELAIDRVRRLVVTAGYIDGDLIFIDPDTHRVVARLFLGRLARSVHIQTNDGRLFVTSSCGIFEVRVNALLEASGFRREQPPDSNASF